MKALTAELDQIKYLLGTMFDLPGLDGVEEVVIRPEVIEGSARPLYIYSDAKIMQDKPQVAAFIAFYLQNVNDNIKDVGYFPAPTSTLYASWGALYAATR